MPLSTAEKTALQSDAKAITDAINALVVDTVDVAALQQQVTDLTAQVATLQGKIDAAKAAMAQADTADVAEDAARAAAQAALA